MTYDNRFTVGGAGATLVVGVTGIDNAVRKLDGLQTEMRARIMTASMRESLKVYRAGLVARIASLTKTGQLKRSIRRRVRKVRGDGKVIEGRLSIGNKVGGRWAFYATWLESGSGLYGKRHRSYEIKAKKGKALLLAGGRMLTRVEHPGIKPRRFMQITSRVETPRATDAFARNIDRDVMAYWNGRA